MRGEPKQARPSFRRPSHCSKERSQYSRNPRRRSRGFPVCARIPFWANGPTELPTEQLIGLSSGERRPPLYAAIDACTNSEVGA